MKKLAASLRVAALLGGVLPSCSSPSTERLAAIAPRPDVTFAHVGLGAGPVLFTDCDGNLVEERRYEPFGVPIDARFATGAAGPPDLAARDLNALNQRVEVATGWSDHGARWMAPETGRWLTPDPPVEGPGADFMAAPWGLHPYQYVDQNPIAYWDPDGRSPSLTERLMHIQQAMKDNQAWHSTVFDAVRGSNQGWKVVAYDASLGHGKTYDAAVRGNVREQVDAVLKLADDAPIKRLLIGGHGYPGVQTMVDETLVDSDDPAGTVKIHPELLRLAGKFTGDGVLVLGGCNLMGGPDTGPGSKARMTEALRAVSTQLGVEVRAGDVKNDSGRDDLWGNVTACRGGTCVTGFREEGVEAAWRERAKD